MFMWSFGFSVVVVVLRETPRTIDFACEPTAAHKQVDCALLGSEALVSVLWSGIHDSAESLYGYRKEQGPIIQTRIEKPDQGAAGECLVIK